MTTFEFNKKIHTKFETKMSQTQHFVFENNQTQVMHFGIALKQLKSNPGREHLKAQGRGMTIRG
jgi:hypothetical protein